jgi:hypothetical protein
MIGSIGRFNKQFGRADFCAALCHGFRGWVLSAMKITRVSGIVYRRQLKPGGPKPTFAGEGRKVFETVARP